MSALELLKNVIAKSILTKLIIYDFLKNFWK